MNISNYIEHRIGIGAADAFREILHSTALKQPSESMKKQWSTTAQSNEVAKSVASVLSRAADKCGLHLSRSGL